jgi:hypothetical protein
MKAPYRSFEQTLSGWPDTLLSVSLVVSGTAIILVGLFAPRTIKVVVLAWIWFPQLRFRLVSALPTIKTAFEAECVVDALCSRLRPLPAPEPAGTGRTRLSRRSVDRVAVGLRHVRITTVSGHRFVALLSGVMATPAFGGTGNGIHIVGISGSIRERLKSTLFQNGQC